MATFTGWWHNYKLSSLRLKYLKVKCQLNWIKFKLKDPFDEQMFVTGRHAKWSGGHAASTWSPYRCTTAPPASRAPSPDRRSLATVASNPRADPTAKSIATCAKCAPKTAGELCVVCESLKRRMNEPLTAINRRPCYDANGRQFRPLGVINGITGRIRTCFPVLNQFILPSVPLPSQRTETFCFQRNDALHREENWKLLICIIPLNEKLFDWNL